MITKNKIETHANFLAQINHDFEMAKLFFAEADLEYETDFITYWLVKRGEETVFIQSSMDVFTVIRKTKVKNDEIRLEVFTKDYSKKYRNSDMLAIIDEGFGLSKLNWKTNLSPNEAFRFFSVSEKMLTLLQEDTDRLLIGINPKSMDASVAADLLYTCLNSLIVKYKHNSKVTTEVITIMEQYEELDKTSDELNDSKLTLLLDKLEKLLTYLS